MTEGLFVEAMELAKKIARKEEEIQKANNWLEKCRESTGGFDIRIGRNGSAGQGLPTTPERAIAAYEIAIKTEEVTLARMKAEFELL